jgi:hypothetical protein
MDVREKINITQEDFKKNKEVIDKIREDFKTTLAQNYVKP